MRTLMMMLMAAVVVTLSATAVQAGSMHDSSSLSAIDSNGYTVVSINHASSDIVLTSHNAVTLDSNGYWTASNVWSGSSESMGMAGSEKMSKDKLYCFDSGSKFCAAAF